MSSSTENVYVSPSILPLCAEGERPVVYALRLADEGILLFHALGKADAFAMPLTEQLFPIPVVRVGVGQERVGWGWHRAWRSSERVDSMPYLLIVEASPEAIDVIVRRRGYQGDGTEPVVTLWHERGPLSEIYEQRSHQLLSPEAEAATQALRLPDFERLRAVIESSAQELEAGSAANIEEQVENERQHLREGTPDMSAKLRELAFIMLRATVREALDGLKHDASGELLDHVRGPATKYADYWPLPFALIGVEHPDWGGLSIRFAFPERLDRMFTFWLYETSDGASQVRSIGVIELPETDVVELGHALRGEPLG